MKVDMPLIKESTYLLTRPSALSTTGIELFIMLHIRCILNSIVLYSYDFFKCFQNGIVVRQTKYMHDIEMIFTPLLSLY